MLLSPSLAASDNVAPRHRASGEPRDSPRTARAAHRPRGPLLLTAAVLTASVVLSGCSTSSDQSLPTQSPAPSGSTGTSGSQDVHFTVGYAGDVLMHMPVMESTPGASGDITDNVAAETSWVEGLDLALCGMEVPVAPDGIYSGYPSFGTSSEVVGALARSGWDGCATASNHAADRGEAGVIATLDALDAHGMGHAGTYRSKEDASVPFALYELERGGRTVTVAQISTTKDLNGLDDPTGHSVSLNDVGAITKAAKSARAAGADLVVVHSQIGQEYETTPDNDQVSYARSLADSGQVDILFGAHPHVPQPAEKLSGGVEGKGMWVSYSAGNYISNQDEGCCAPLSDVGQLVWADITSHADGSVSVDKLNWHPFTMDLAGGHKIRDLAALHNGERPANLGLSTEQIDRRWSLLTSQVKDASTMSTTPPKATGSAPTIPSREEVITRAGAHPGPQGTASASPSPR